METASIPTSFPDYKREETFCEIVDRVELKINDRDIESCYRVGTQGRTIVQFSQRKTASSS